MKKLLSFIFAAVTCSLLQAAAPLYVFSWDGVNSNDVKAGTTYTDPAGVTSVLVKRDGLTKSSEIMSTKVRTIEMDLTKITPATSAGESIGSLFCFFKNGSTSQSCVVNVYYSNGDDYEETDVLTVKAQDSLHYYPKNIVTKSKVKKVKFEFSVDCYLYGIQLVSHEEQDGAPLFVSSYPAAEESLPSAGEVYVTFDEFVSLNSSSDNISFGTATVTYKSVQGNLLKVGYSGLVLASTLYVPDGAISDFDGNVNNTSVSLSFFNDVNVPTVKSVSPAQGSTIHIQDLGEQERMIKVKFNEKIALSVDAQLGNKNIGVTCGGVSVGSAYAIADDSVLVVSYSGLAYSKECQFVIPDGFVEDISGNPFGGTTLAYITCERDHDAPKLVGQSVANGETGKNVSGSIQITFNEDVKIVSQGATVNGKPAVLTANGNIVGLNYSNLDYSSEQTVSLASGCIADTCNNVYEQPLNISFTTKQKEMGEATFIVGKDDGYGYDDSYSTIQEAIDAIDDDSQRSIIYVRPGVYNEKLVVDKKNVSIIGQHRDSVVIAYNECASTSTAQPDHNTGLVPGDIGTTVASYTMLIAADNFYGEGFTVRNDYDWINSTDNKRQNVALCRTSGDGIVLNNVSLEGVENVYFSKKTTGRVYMTNCRLVGGSDIITSGGTVVADSCSFEVIKGGRSLSAAFQSDYDFGIVLYNSNVSQADTTGFFIPAEKTYYAGRPKKNGAKITMLDCSFENDILSESAWSNSISEIEDAEQVNYNEYGTRFMSAEEAAATTQRPNFVTILTEGQAAEVTPDRVMNLGAKGGVWNPYEYIHRPESVIVSFDVDLEEGYCVMTWPENAHDAGYIVFKNGHYFDNVTSNELTDYTYTGNDVYEIAAYNEFGAMSRTTLNYHEPDYDEYISTMMLLLPNVGVEEVEADESLLEYTVVRGSLKLKRDDISKVEIYSLSAGLVLNENVGGSDTVSVGALAPGAYVARGVSESGAVFAEKFIVK
ncbi:MAG: Ig-like domain-containing protein [Paludibacteraceae bacterium]|nr:Ig-like domain-containing protein [Paludibacteraceae bacterium]